MQSNLTIPKYGKSPNISRDSSIILHDTKTTTMHSRVQSALLTPSGMRASIMNSELGFRSIPSSPKAPATMPMFSSKDDDQEVVSRAAKSTRLMRKISAFAANPSIDFGVKAKTVNAIEARKVQSYQSPRLMVPRSPLNIMLQSHGNFFDHFGRSPSASTTSLLALKDELDLVEKKYSPLVIEHHKFVYFQIPCYDMPSPLVINIVKGTNGTSNGRLKVFVSKFNKRPSALSCDYTVESRNIKIYEKDYKDNFEAPAYYFGIYSEGKFEGKVMFFFGETLNAVKRERPHGISFNLKQNWKTRAQDVDPINVEEITHIKKDLRKKRWLAGGCVNRVERNKSIKSPDDKQKQLIERRVLLESRSSDAHENKNIRESMKLQRKMFLAERHNIQKAVRSDDQMKLEVKILKMILHRDWIQALVFPVLMKNLKRMYDEKREAFKRRQRVFLKIHLFNIRYRRKLQRKGPSLLDRIVFDIRGALELHVRSLTIVQKTELQSVAAKLFAEYALYAKTVKSVFRTHTILKKFAERWLLGKKRKQIFIKVVGMIWDKYHAGILSELSPTEIKRPETNLSLDGEETVSIVDKKAIKEEKRKKFVEYMLNYSYYKFNKNIHRFRLNFEDLEPKLKKTADYAKHFLLDRKKFIKNSLITKVENCDINAIFSHDINLSDSVYELYHKIDIIRPPKLFYIPKARVVQKAVIALAKGDSEIKTMESLPEFIIY